MSNRKTTAWLQDMLVACQRILHYTEGLDYAKFASDFLTQDACLRNIQILGEAAQKLSATFKDQHSQIEWSKIIRSRHILVHEYHQVDLEIVWRIIEDYLPELSANLEKLIAQVKEE